MMPVAVNLEAPVLADERRTTVGRVKMLLVLLVCAGLMMKSLYNVLNADPGFDSEGVLVAMGLVLMASSGSLARKFTGEEEGGNDERI